MSLPAIDAVSAHWPAAEIDILVGRHSSVVYSYRPRHRVRRIPDQIDRGSTMRLGSMLHREGYDAVICLDRSRWIQFAIRLAQPRISTFVKPLRPEHRHEAEVYL
ncbi:MAG: glycosyltransferase family 9 protein, partial [Vicinamibacterales bacterium]